MAIRCHCANNPRVYDSLSKFRDSSDPRFCISHILLCYPSSLDRNALHWASRGKWQSHVHLPRVEWSGEESFIRTGLQCPPLNSIIFPLLCWCGSFLVMHMRILSIQPLLLPLPFCHCPKTQLALILWSIQSKAYSNLFHCFTEATIKSQLPQSSTEDDD